MLPCSLRQSFSAQLLVAPLVVLAATTALSACSGRVDTGSARMDKVETRSAVQVKDGAGGTKAANQSDMNPSGGPTANMHEGDMATMEVVSNDCLKAWRKAIAGDEDGALAILDDLDKRYPSVLTVQMMTGQVYEHFHDNKKAIEHYRKAVTGNEFSSFHVFKLAEAMRKNGDTKGAIPYYRKVLKSAPQFGAADVGLAQCLLAQDKQSGEARTLLSDAAKDPLAAKDAKALLEQIEPGAKAGN